MTLHVGPYADRVGMEGLLVLYEYRFFLGDLVAALLGWAAWQNYKDYNSTEPEPWQMIQLRYETVYYIHRTYLDYNRWRAVHHVLCLGYLYWGWVFKTALSTAFYFSALSNCPMALMQKHPNKFTKISFAISFFVARLVYGTWVMWGVMGLPVRGSEAIIVPMAASLYVMQWWWGLQIYRHVKKAFKAPDLEYLNGGDAPQ
jgi:hypothetical protein